MLYMFAHFLRPFITTTIPLLLVPKVKHEEYFRIEMLLFLQVFLSCPSSNGSHRLASPFFGIWCNLKVDNTMYHKKLFKD